MMYPDIHLDQLCKDFGSTRVLDRLTLHFQPGTISCLLGRNGAGKTTTLRSIVGLTRPSGGRVLIGGTDVQDPRFRLERRRIGYLPEEPVLYDHLTGREFLRFIADLHGPDSPARERVDSSIRELGLQGEAETVLRKCSMGTRKRIAFLAATIADPPILILDEPTGALDAVSARIVREILCRERDRGRTILFTTHVMEIAERLADRVAILRSGRLRREGTPEALRTTEAMRPGESLEDIFLRLTDPDQPEDTLRSAANPAPTRTVVASGRAGGGTLSPEPRS